MLYLNDHPQSIPEEQILRLLDLLPEQRRQAALRFRFPEGRRDAVLAYVELCRGLALEHGISEMPTFTFNPHGKPLLPQHPDIHFSLSHCSQAVGCLIASTPCGMDVERIRPLSPSLVHHTMCPQEEADILQHPFPALRFTQLWTCKEAVFKLLGSGITDGIKDILLSPCLAHIRLQTLSNPARGYVVTTAVSDSEEHI